MHDSLDLRLAGYAPRDSTHGRALDTIASSLRSRLGAEIEVDHNILDSGRPIQALLEDVERGRTTLCFFSTSYLAERVPELGIIDLPYLFDSLEAAHEALDGAFGRMLSDHTRQRTQLVPLGYWDNGFRHLSNRSRVIRRPEDCRGLRIRLQPNWAHEALFRELGAEPVGNDLREGIAMLHAGELDAQENPLANFVAYGIHEIHPHLTMTAHVYGARGVYASADALARLPDEVTDALQEAVRVAIVQQRVDARRTEAELRERLEREGTHVVDPTEEEHAAFRAAAGVVMDRARERFADPLWRLLAA